MVLASDTTTTVDTGNGDRLRVLEFMRRSPLESGLAVYACTVGFWPPESMVVISGAYGSLSVRADTILGDVRSRAERLPMAAAIDFY
jgi:hypothetical protein